MMNRSQKYTISGVLTLLTVATTAGISRGGPEGIPAQLTPNINVFRESETVNGVTLEKDAHNIVICPAGTASPVADQALHQTDYRFWAYEYSGNEPAVLGKFYISWGELLANPQYESINTLRSFTGGKRYYVMSSITLQFRCNIGLTKSAECGNGILEGDERCDVVHEGCNQTACKPNEGYVCQNNACKVYIPVLGGGSSSTATSQSSRINENWHTECRNNACVTVEGFGAPNQCQLGRRCGSSNSSIGSSQSSVAQKAGNLFVTQYAGPVRGRQLLGGALENSVLGITLRAEGDEIDVTALQFATVNTSIQIASVDRLELYRADQTMPIAVATISGCGSRSATLNTFCTSMEDRQLVIPRGENISVFVRPRMKSDVDGAIAGEEIQFVLKGDGSSVQARGATTHSTLLANNGNALAEGEVFIGTSVAAPNQNITGQPNDSVLSKIISVLNANPDENGTAVPTGVSAIGQFKFHAAQHSNTKNGMNDAVIDGLIFTVTNMNVVMEAQEFKFYNKANSTVKKSCEPLYFDGTPYTSAQIAGSFLLRCSNLAGSDVDTAIDPGSDQTFVVQGSVVNPNMSTGGNSALQIALNNFTDQGLPFGPGQGQSHILWFDEDLGSSAHQTWIEYPETIVKSTSYAG